ncbi:hypothetical protein [Streptomyces sp. NPDC095613]|uniref:hypothetical protein n=1 Tax=Streptomyces sp. NPDC095613 TaxID=3155540 RepID=UPI003330776C
MSRARSTSAMSGMVNEARPRRANRASAPRDAGFDGAAVYRITVPPAALEADGEVLLRLSYTGDVARVYINGQLVADHFW